MVLAGGCKLGLHMHYIKEIEHYATQLFISLTGFADWLVREP